MIPIESSRSQRKIRCQRKQSHFGFSEILSCYQESLPRRRTSISGNDKASVGLVPIGAFSGHKSDCACCPATGPPAGEKTPEFSRIPLREPSAARPALEPNPSVRCAAASSVRCYDLMASIIGERTSSPAQCQRQGYLGICRAARLSALGGCQGAVIGLIRFHGRTPCRATIRRSPIPPGCVERPRAQRGFFPQKSPNNATCTVAERSCGNGERLRKNQEFSAKIPRKMQQALLLKGVTAIVSDSAKIHPRPTQVLFLKVYCKHPTVGGRSRAHSWGRTFWSVHDCRQTIRSGPPPRNASRAVRGRESTARRYKKQRPATRLEIRRVSEFDARNALESVRATSYVALIDQTLTPADGVSMTPVKLRARGSRHFACSLPTTASKSPLSPRGPRGRGWPRSGRVRGAVASAGSLARRQSPVSVINSSRPAIDNHRATVHRTGGGELHRLARHPPHPSPGLRPTSPARGEV
jgi:hypothetical protein